MEQDAHDNFRQIFEEISKSLKSMKSIEKPERLRVRIRLFMLTDVGRILLRIRLFIVFKSEGFCCA